MSLKLKFIFSLFGTAIIAVLLVFAGRQIIIHPPVLNWQSIKLAGLSLAALALVFFLLEWKMRQGKWLLVLMPFLILATGKGQSLAAVLMFCLANLGVGQWLYAALVRQKSGDTVPAAPGTAFFLGLAANAIVIWLAMHFKVNYSQVYYAFFAAELILCRGQWLQSCRQLGSHWKGISVGQQMLILAGGIYLLYALVPNYMFDDLICHLYVPKYVQLFGKWHYHPGFVSALDLALVPRSAYTALFLMDGEYAVRIFNVLTYFIGFLCLEQMIRVRFNARTALFAVLLAITTPFVVWQMGVVFLDSFQFYSAVILFGTAMLAWDRPTVRSLLLYFIVAALAYLYKQHAVMLILPTGLVIGGKVLYLAYREKKADLLLGCGLGAVIFSLILSPFLIHNYLIAGNPMFPYFNSIFKSPWFYPTNFADTRWQHPVDWKFLYNITFHGTRYIENIDFAFGLAFFVLLPGIPWLLVEKQQRRESAVFILIFMLGACLWVVLTNPYLRYFTTIMPVGVLLLALSLDRFLYWMGNRTGWRIFLTGLFSLLITANFALQMSIVNVTTPYPLKAALLKDYTNSSLAFYSEIKKIFQYTKKHFGRDGKALFVGLTPFLYFNECRVETVMWYNYAARKRLLEEPQTSEELYRRVFEEEKFDYIVMPLTESEEYKKYYEPGFMSRLANTFSAAGYGVFQPKQETQPPARDEKN